MDQSVSPPPEQTSMEPGVDPASVTITRIDAVRPPWWRARITPRWQRPARVAGLAGLFLLITLAMLRPSPSDIENTLPNNLGDPAFVTWTLRYGAHAVTTDPLDVFDAPIFWPEDNAYTYSESILPAAPVYAVIYAVVGDTVVAMNLIIVAFFVFNLLATYGLARYLVVDRRASFLAALAFGFSGYVMARAGHPHLQPVGVFPLGYLASFRMLDRPTVARGVVAGLANAVAFLTCLYYGAIWGVCYAILIGGWLLARRLRVSRATVLSLGVMALVSTVLILPVVAIYADRDLGRTADPDMGLKLHDFLIPATGTYVHRWLEGRATVPSRIEHTYFPGVTVALLAVGGVAAAAVHGYRRRRMRSSPAVGRLEIAEPCATSAPTSVRREALVLVCLGGLAGFVLALGPWAGDVMLPFEVFRAHVPGFSGIRVPSRLAVPALLSIALLAGLGASYLLRRLSAGKGLALTALLGALMLVEFAAPVDRVALDRSHAVMAVYEELAGRPAGPTVELPMIDPAAGVDWPFVEAPRMVRATVDWHPRVNGYSGGAPEGYGESAYLFNRFPSSASLAHAGSLGVRYVIVHTGPVAGPGNYSLAEADEMLTRLPSTAHAERFGEAWLVDLGEQPS